MMRRWHLPGSEYLKVIIEYSGGISRMLRSMTSPDTPAQQILKSLDRDVRHSRPNQANSAHLAGLALQIFILLTLVVMPVAAQKATPKAKSKVGQK
ncbi:MAG: hypothetical protein ACK5RS_00335, partial [Acidobacteriota bacterium]